ncbi:hypothetical protein GCM10022206_86670 [Streptomyces chiangmaiensis]
MLQRSVREQIVTMFCSRARRAMANVLELCEGARCACLGVALQPVSRNSEAGALDGPTVCIEWKRGTVDCDDR